MLAVFDMLRDVTGAIGLVLNELRFKVGMTYALLVAGGWLFGWATVKGAAFVCFSSYV